MYAEPDQHAHEILSILEYALILFRDDHITQAVDLVDSVKPKIKHLPVELQATVQEVFQTKNMRELDSLGNCVISFFNFLNDSSQWKNTWRQNEIAISTSINKTTGVHYFKTAGELHGVDIVSVLGALMENDLFGAWMPCCGSSREVPSSNSETGPLASEEEIPNSTRRVIQSVFEIMMFKREALFFGVGDVLSNGDVFVFIKSLPEAELVTSSSIPRVKLEGGFLFGHGATPTSPIRAEIAFSLDPLLDFLPHWILNYCIEQVTCGLLPRLQEQARLFEVGQKYHNRIAYGLGPSSPALPTGPSAAQTASATHTQCIYYRIKERIWRAKHRVHRQQQSRSELMSGSPGLLRPATPPYDPSSKATGATPSPSSIAAQV